MKKRYSIGFCILTVVFTLLLSIAYQWSYQKSLERIQPEEQPILTEGPVQKEDGYIIGIEDGYVIVYLSDQKTVFEYTSIPANELPQSLQTELESGKQVESLQEVYGFLENYSS